MRTGQEYLESLRDGRRVYVGGELIEDVTTRVFDVYDDDMSAPYESHHPLMDGMQERFQGIERRAALTVDRALAWLEQQPDVHTAQIGMTGISLGGHFAPRAVAYEPRFAAGAVWGANHNWAEVQQRRLQREGENPVPHYWSHVHWAFGARDMADFLQKSAAMNLNGHLDRIRVPFLVTHGAGDRQIPLAYAHQTHEQLVNSPRRELKIFTAREGGVEHVGADNMSFAREYIADWFAAQLGGHVG